MTVIFGTLGHTPEKLLPTVRSRADAKELVFFHDHNPKGKAAAARVRAFCKDRDLKVTPVEVNAFDILECAGQMRREIRKHDPTTIVFNLTGGTPVISSAATLVCILEGVCAVYVHEETKDEIALPLLTVRYESMLNPAQRRVLRFVSEQGEAGCSQTAIAEALDLRPSTVSHHVKNLKLQQLVSVERDDDNTRTDRVTIMPSAVLLLEDAA